VSIAVVIELESVTLPLLPERLTVTLGSILLVVIMALLTAQAVVLR
jgi:hypothetical protein